MSHDDWTPNVRAAELHERHHGIAPTPASHGITAADVDFRMAGEHACGGDPNCWTCFVLPQTRAALTAELRRLG